MKKYHNLDVTENELFWNNELERMNGFHFDADYCDTDMQIELFEVDQQIIDGILFERVEKFCKNNKCTPYHVVLTAVMCALFEIEYKENITVWIAVSNPFYKEFFANMSVVSLPLCVEFLNKNVELISILKTIVVQTAHIIDYQDISLNELLEKKEYLTVQNVDEISNVFFNFTEDENTEYHDVEEIMLYDVGNTKYELNIDCTLSKNKLSILVSYKANLFRKSRVIKTLDKVTEFIDRILLNEYLQLSNNHIEKKMIYQANNSITKEYYNIVNAFMKNIETQPDADAIIMGTCCLNYKQVYNRILKIISYISSKGIKRNDCVAIIAEKNLDSITCVIALLFGGYTYVPISKEYPQERVENIIKSCKIKGIIFDDYLKNYNMKEVKLFSISKVVSVDVSKEYKAELIDRCDSEIAYIMHTSGSTGKPKGVKVSWKNLSNYCSPDGLSKIISSISSFRILSVSNLEFDISLTEIFLPIIYGGCCIVVPKVLEDDLLLIKYVTESSADVIQTTPTNIKRLMLFFKGEWLHYLNLVLIGGESFPRTLYNEIRQKTEASIINVYGPTEATVWSTYKIIEEEPIHNIIGNCLSDYKVCIMQNGKEADIECVGEICIGGAGVAIGYVDEGSGKEFKQIKEERFYFTGDMGRRLLSKEIEFIGRKDTQIKKGGYRIELEEIAEIAKEIPGIQDAVACIKYNENEEHICLFYTKAENQMIDHIGRHLSGKLPKYMLPTYFVEVKEIPLTTSGKINVKRLSVPCWEKKCFIEEESLSIEQNKILALIKDVFSKDTIYLSDNFWKIGGTSIKAVALINAVEKEYGFRIKLARILQKSDIKDIVDYISMNIKNNFLGNERYHATQAQKRIYAMQVLNKASTSYNMPALIRIRQYFEPEEIRNRIVEIINGFKILRTRFRVDENELWQIVFPYDKSAIRIVRNNIDPYEEMKTFIQPFSLENEPLFRAEILVINNDEYLLFDIHHIISDDVSNNLIFDMLEDALLYKKPIGIENAEYNEYSELLCRQSYEEEEHAWSEYFKKIKIERLSLPRENPLDFSNMEGAKRELLFPECTLEKLHKLSAEIHCSVYSILLTFLFVLLKKICYQDMITVACPTSSRNIEKFENSLGLFVNTSIISNNIVDNKTLEDLIAEIQERIFFAIENVNYPFEKIANFCEVESVNGQNPVFDVMFNYYEDYTYNLLELLEINSSEPKVDLTFNISQKGKELLLECEYVKNHFSKNRIDTILRQYSQLLNLYLNKLNIPVNMCDTCLPDEKEILIKKFNNPIDYNYSTKCLQDYLKMRTQLQPDDVAVEMDSMSIDFKQLDMESNMMAQKLIVCGAKINEVIPLIIHRSIEMFIGIWGILKAGCAYLPIKPEEPEVRIKYMANRAKVNYIVCGREEYTQLEGMFPDLQLIIVDRENYKTGENCTIECKSQSDNLAYVIYTSGTTGDPKGVMVEHGSVVNRIEWMVKKYDISSKDKILFKTPFNFDVSVWEIFIGIFCGATVCILPDGDEKEPGYIEKSILEYGISVIHFVPSMLNVFLDYLRMHYNYGNKIYNLRYIFSSGEALKKDTVKKFYNFFYNTKLINLYGPTEATVDVTYYDCTGKEDLIPIGKPIKNINIFILNGNTLTGIGIKGELCITGLGVAKGYINDARLSDDKFVNNLFGCGKMYRTGDIACWNSSGDILFFGRKDKQVKIRGYRIELGEIEDKILTLAGVKDVNVFAESSRLTAHVVGQREQINPENIKNELALLLPSYMIPNNILLVHTLSLSSNGKALGIDATIDDTVESNCTEFDSLDRLIIEIMTKVLGHHVKLNDNFVKSGGDSIQAIYAANEFHKAGITVLAKDIVVSKDLHDIKRFIRKEGITLSENKTNLYSISPIMKDFFNEWPIEDKNYFNQSCLLIIEKYDEEKLIDSIKKIIDNHDMFRAEFSENKKFVINKNNDTLLNKVLEKTIISNKYLSEEIYDISDKVQKSISLIDNILFKFVIIKSEDKNYLFICVHHLIIDAVSWGIILYELETLYQNQSALLQERMSYGEWTGIINDYRKNITILEKNYWLSIVKKMQVNNREDNICELTSEVEYTFKYLNLQVLREKIQTHVMDEKCLVLALIVKSFEENNTIIFDIENYGRGAIEDIDIAGTVGWFTLIFPMIIEPQANLHSLIHYVFEKFDYILNDGIAYSLLKDEFRQIGYNCLQAKYCYNYLGKMKNYVSDNFIEIHTEPLAADVGYLNSMGYDIVFNVFESDNILKIRIVYKNSKGSMIKDLCERMDILQGELNILFNL